MNGLHDNPHKRTSINELLNPVASSPAASLDGPYRSPPLSSLPPANYVPTQQQQQHVSSSAAHYSTNSAGGSFSLRAASWDRGSTDSGITTQRRQESEASTSACRYGSATPHSNGHPGSHQTNSHSVYAEQYQRSRPVDEPANYGMDVSWSPNSHEHTPPVSYGGQLVSPAPPMVSPVYSEERAAISNGDSVQKSTVYTPPTIQLGMQPPVQPGQYDQQEMHPQATYIPNGYIPFMLGPANPRAMQPQAMLQQRMPPVNGVQQLQGVYIPHAQMFAIPFMMPPPPPMKRQLDPGDEETAAPKKKPRGKAKAADGGSRRGYSSKKRNEAAQIAAQSATAASSNGKGKERETSRETDRPPPSLPMSGATTLHPELQFARCMSNRYRTEEFPRCVSCTRRWAGDTCRFQGIRFFLKDENRNIIGISFVENHKADGPTMNFPVKWNVPLELRHIDRLKRTVAKALLPVLKKEQEHIKHPEVIRRTRESEVRATCDTCMTSIFSSSWMCRLCGREACAECFAQVRELTTDREGATEAEIAALQARREKHAHINPFFLSCTRRNEHRASDFSPMSRFSKDELDQAIVDMEALLAEKPAEEASSGEKKPVDKPVEQFANTNGVSNGALNGAPDGASDSGIPKGVLNGKAASSTSSPDSSPGGAATTNGEAGGSSSAASAPGAVPAKTPDTEVSLQLTKTSVDSPIPPEPSTFPSVSGTSTQALSGSPTIPCHQTHIFTDAELTDEAFQKVWTLGEPIVVTDLGPKFRIEWTPDYFRHKYGSQSCLILECQTDQNKRVTVGEFFSWFGKYEGRRDCWKLKDWPPSTDFKSAFPELYDDFAQATPVPNYVRRDGVYNIASHFPSNTVAPDLGPKMYNAMASYEAENSKGSTRLHMDMADAINIMLFAAMTPDGRPGCAAWDLFKSEDSPKLRKFLRRKFKGQYTNDPIHSQQFYLDSKLRQELYDEFGVKSYRIYQRPGDAVFIPAGCAHQVCNLADCIKVASDFVSPDNIDRCEMLTREFREQNQSMAWKEDVLQLRTMMWFAWLSCTRQEKEIFS